MKSWIIKLTVLNISSFKDSCGRRSDNSNSSTHSVLAILCTSSLTSLQRSLIYNREQRDLSEDKMKEVAWIFLGVWMRLEAGQHRRVYAFVWKQ